MRLPDHGHGSTEKGQILVSLHPQHIPCVDVVEVFEAVNVVVVVTIELVMVINVNWKFSFSSASSLVTTFNPNDVKTF